MKYILDSRFFYFSAKKDLISKHICFSLFINYGIYSDCASIRKNALEL